MRAQATATLVEAVVKAGAFCCSIRQQVVRQPSTGQNLTGGQSLEEQQSDMQHKLDRFQRVMSNIGWTSQGRIAGASSAELAALTRVHAGWHSWQLDSNLSCSCKIKPNRHVCRRISYRGLIVNGGKDKAKGVDSDRGWGQTKGGCRWYPERNRRDKGAVQRKEGADLEGGDGLWGLRPACCQHCALLLQLASPDMLTGVRADGRQQQRLHLHHSQPLVIFLFSCLGRSQWVE